jgi:hypothetical protein
VGCRISLTGGTGGSGQFRTITAYTGSTRVATVSTAFSPVPDNTTTYSIAGALLQNIDISGCELTGGPMSGHDGTNPFGLRIINAMDVHVSGVMVRDSIRDSYYFQDVMGRLTLDDLRNTDPQDPSGSYYGGQLLSCSSVVISRGAMTRSTNHVWFVSNSKVLVAEFLAFGLATGNAGFRALNTAADTTRLTVTNSKFTRALGATSTRAIRCDGTATSYALLNCDLSECDQMVFDGAVPASGVIERVIPTSLQTIIATTNNATPSVRGARIIVTGNTSATTITDLTNGYEGQIVEIHIADANTTVDFTGTNLKGNAGADWSPANDDAMVCTKRGALWYCKVAKLV